MQKPDLTHAVGDLWGGLAAMLVALPSAIAFGVVIFSALDPALAGQGALAGILGATALGLIAPALGGTNRLITAPCAPAAAVLSAFALQYVSNGGSPAGGLVLLAVLAVVAGGLQILFGVVRLGRLIKYMPYPVVSGYLSGVGLIIIGSQLPKFLGAPKGNGLWQSLAAPQLWQWQALTVGVVTAGVMVLAPRVTKAVPAAILALAAGVATYFGLGFIDAGLLQLEHNPLIIGPLGGQDVSFTAAFKARFDAASGLNMDAVEHLLVPAATLAVLLSIDTLKTCVVLDALTRSRHDSNRELIAQGSGNLASAFAGGIPGAGTMGATLVNISSGAQTRLSGVIEGLLALIAFLLLGHYISWIPVASLAAILIVIGVRMIDTHSFSLIRSRNTILDFAVIAAVIIVALTASLIAASGVGIILAVILFIREQISSTVVHHKSHGHEMFSKRVRVHEEMEVLTREGVHTTIVELQGGLFFGTTDQLYRAIETDLKSCKYLILDMRRVQTVDVTAVHLLDQVRDMLHERQGMLIFSQIPQQLPSGKDMQQYFDEVGLVREEQRVRVFGELDEALEWVENEILRQAALTKGEETNLELTEVELFKGRKAETLSALEQCMDKRSFRDGERIFKAGDAGDELYVIRRGAVRIVLPLNERLNHHLGTFGRGAFFGEMSFLDGAVRSADAIASGDTELYVLSRKTFDSFAEEHKKVGMHLMEGIASALASRLRYTNAELRALES